MVYGASGMSTSPSGLVLRPFLRRSAGSSVERAPAARISARKAAQAGLREERDCWKASRERGEWHVIQMRERR